MPVGFTYQLFTNYQTYFQTGVSMLDYKVHCTYNNVNVKIQYNTWFCAKKVPKKMDAHSSISKQRFIEVSKNKYKASASILYWPTMHQLLIFKSFQGLFDKDVPHWLAKGPQKSPEAGFKLFINKRSTLDAMSEWLTKRFKFAIFF